MNYTGHPSCLAKVNMRLLLLIAVLAGLAGCRRNPEEEAVSEPTPPPAAAFASQHQSLDEGLKALDEELQRAMRGSLEGQSAKEHFLRAEAITDRLLEADLPFLWLKSRDYSVESAVRQIQALADRVVAQVRNGLDGARIEPDVRELRQKVLRLRQDLAAGGGPPPLPLDSLLARYARDTPLVTAVGE